MEKIEKHSLNRRLLFIYIGYFVVLALGFMHSIMPSISNAFNVGYSQSAASAQLMAQGVDHDWYLVTVKPQLFLEDWSHLSSNNRGVELGGSMYEGFVSITAQHSQTPVELREVLATLSDWSFVFEMVSIVAWVVILVLVGLIINSLRKSVRDQQPIDSRNILKMRLIGAMIIVDQIAAAVVLIVCHRMVNLASGGAINIQGLPIEYGQLVLGLLIIFAAEIIAIGARLGEEQKLTI